MRLSSFAPIITAMFKDKMDVYRHASIINSNGTKSVVRPETPTTADTPCKVSFDMTETPKNTAIDHTPIMTTPKIFCLSSLDIVEGDFVVIRRFDDYGNIVAVYSGLVGLPSTFITHQEVLFLIKGGA